MDTRLNYRDIIKKILQEHAVNLVNQINQRMVKKIQEGTEEESKKKAHSQKGKKQENAQIKGN